MDLKIEEMYMGRALQLAANGEGRVFPNPLVGAVIVNNDRIIGEGFHSFFGGPHAEVNAINSVKESDKKLLKDSTLYVTLEPCSHHGKTPPCTDLIVSKEIPRVVIGSSDPNPLVAGKGFAKLKDAGIEVKEGVLKEKCDFLNRRFIKAHTSEYPWIILKWAQSADGFISGIDKKGEGVPVKFSSLLSSVWMHRQRANVDAILIGSNTEKKEHPLLNVRNWGGNSPQKLVAEKITDLHEYLIDLRKKGITSLMVEGGATLLSSFIKNDFYDEIRIEKSPKKLVTGIKAPAVPVNVSLEEVDKCNGNIIELFRR